MKKKKHIWKYPLLWIGAAAMLLSVGCTKQNATEESAMQLDMVQMLETAQSEAETSNEKNADPYAWLGAPKEMKLELTGTNGRLHVHVDAPVTLPGTELPIVRTKKRVFTLDEARLFATVLFGENAHYTVNPFENPTAGYCRKQAEKLRVAIDDWNGQGNIRYDLQYETVEEARQAMEDWLAKAAVAPESLLATEPDYTWQHPSTWSEAEGEVKTTDTYLYLHAMPDDETCSQLFVNNNMQFSGHSELKYVRDSDKQIHSLWADDADISAFVTMSQEEAYEIAQQTMDALGLDDFTCVQKQRNLSDFKDWGAYGFVFTRSISGIPETYTDADGAWGTENKTLKYERVSVLVDDAGVLQFWYDAPCTVLDIVSTQTTLLPFSEIQSVFEKMILIVNNITEDKSNQANNIEYEYYITGVQLGVMTVVEDGETNTGLLIPVWDFIGRAEYSSDLEGRQEIYTNERHAFLTINAIDGTIIDRTQGY